MPIIYTFPLKGTPVLADLVLISDSQNGEATKNATISSIRDTIDVVDRITAGSGISVSNATGNITIGNTGVLSLTAGTNISLSGSTGAITIGASGVGGSGTANKITKWSANGSDIENSIISQPVGNAITIAGNLSITSGNYIQSPRILDSAFSAGSANQILSAGSSGSSIEWTSTFKGDLNGTINTATTGVTQANAIDNTTIATTAYVNNKIGLIPAGLEYSGTWDANTNNPTLASGVGTTGAFYIVAASGSTNLDGITDWKVGDWAIFVESGATDAWQKVDNTSVLNGSGTGQKVSLWSGSGTSVTLTDSIMTQNPAGGNFAGQYIDISGSGGISASQFSIGGRLLDSNNFQGIDGYVLSSTTVGGNRKTAWVPPLTTATTTNLGGVKTVGQFGGNYIGNPITTTSGRNYGIAITSGDSKLLVNVPWTDTDSGAILATTSTLGGIKLGTGVTASAGIVIPTSSSNRNYPLQVNSAGNGIVNVPWVGTSSTAGTGLTLNGTVFNANVDGTQSVAANTSSATALRTYKVQVDSGDNLVVNVPWVDTNTTLQATATTIGGMKIFSDAVTVAANPRTNTASRSYGIQINAGGAGQVNVPWENTTDTASVNTIGGVKLVTPTVAASQTGVSTTAFRNYGLQIDSNSRGVINVPWTDTTYTTATSSTLGLVKIGYSENGKNYPVELLNDQMFVNVPWVDTNTTPLATGSTVGGMLIFSETVTVAPNPRTNTASRTYGIQINSGGGGVVNVPWTDTTPTASQSTIGGLKLVTNVTGTLTNSVVTSTSLRNYAIQRDSNTRAMVNVPWTDTVPSAATPSALGTIKTHTNFGSQQTINSTTTTSSRNYAVNLNTDDKAFVNVPWTDNGTTYTAGTGLTLTGTVFSANTVGTQSNLANTASSVAGRSYPVQTGAASGTVGSDHLIVNIPWTDTQLTAGTNINISGNVVSSTTALASTGTVGGFKLLSNTNGTTPGFITTTADRNYAIQRDSSGRAMVNIPWTDTAISLTTSGTGAATLSASDVLNIPTPPTITASQGLTKTSNNITLDIADPATGWAILGGGAGVTTSIIGARAGANATGSKNFGISDFVASTTVTSANNNVAIGFQSMGSNVITASNNVVIGSNAGANTTTVTDSVLIGANAGSSMESANNVVLVGQDAGKGITIGGENTIIGSNAGETITTGSRNTIIGSGAIASSGAASVFATIIGREASATTSSVAVGSNANVAGATGVAVGDSAVTASNAPNGIALGKGANATLQGTVGNVAIGSSANPVSLDQPEAFSANVNHLNVTINGTQYYIRLYKEGE